jgi:hypothetical protein
MGALGSAVRVVQDERTIAASRKMTGQVTMAEMCSGNDAVISTPALNPVWCIAH